MGPSLFFPWLSVNENTRRTIAQKIRAMFVGGVEGAWYDPSDLSTMFRDYASNPVTASGHLVAVMLDKRQGLALGTERFAPGVWTPVGSGLTGSGSTVTATAAVTGGNWAQIVTTATVGAWHEVSVTVTSLSAGSFRVNLGGSTESRDLSAVGTYRLVLFSDPSSIFYVTGGAVATTGTLVVNSVKAIAGNHAYQLTSASRPIFRDVGGLRYLEFDGVDDYLRATFTIAQPIDRISAIQQVSWTHGDWVFGSVSANDSGGAYQTTVSPRIDFYSGAGINGATVSPAMGVSAVLTERHDGASSRLARNAEAYVTGNLGTTLPGGVTIAARYDGSTPGNIFLHQLIMRGGPTAMTDTQIDLCRKVCYDAAGLPLPGYEETEVSRMWSSDPTATGAWYDPSDLSTMFQNSSGMEPVTSTGQTVWLMLDKSRGLVRGTENITTQDLAASPWASGGAFGNLSGATAVGATLTTLAASGSRRFRIACTPGQWFEATAITEGVAGTIPQIAIAFGTSGAALIEINYSGAGSAAAGVVNQVIAKAPAAAAFVEICLIVNGPGAGDDGIFGSVSLRELPGNHAIQPTSASRPVFRDVGGLRYLEFDGVDDFLRATFTIAQPIDRISAIQQVSWTNTERILSSVVANDAATMYQASVTPRLDFFSGVNINGATISPALGTNAVMTERYSGASSRIAKNNEAYITGDGGTALPGGITVGARYNDSIAANFHLYQLIMRGSTTAMTDAQIAACRALSAVKSGVTL